MRPTSLSGAQYLSNGLSLIWKPGIRNFVFIPLMINIVLLSIATVYAFNNISSWYETLHSNENSIIQWMVENLDWLLWPLIVISVLIVVFFLFSFLANWIAAPFNGLLAEAVENYLDNQKGLSISDKKQDIFSMKDFIADIPRLIIREWKKLAYFLPRALVCLILFFVPPLTVIAPFIWFFFNAWMAVIQYVDYPMDNHKVSFEQMLSLIKQKKSISLSFGLVVMFLTMIPIVNIFLMPVAVAGATNLWHDNFKD